MSVFTVAGPNPVKIKLSKSQKKELEIIVGRRNSFQGLVLRAKIILLADEGKSNVFIAKELGVDANTVRLWRKRWPTCEKKIAKIEDRRW